MIRLRNTFDAIASISFRFAYLLLCARCGRTKCSVQVSLCGSFLPSIERLSPVLPFMKEMVLSLHNVVVYRMNGHFFCRFCLGDFLLHKAPPIMMQRCHLPWNPIIYLSLASLAPLLHQLKKMSHWATELLFVFTIIEPYNLPKWVNALRISIINFFSLCSVVCNVHVCLCVDRFSCDRSVEVHTFAVFIRSIVCMDSFTVLYLHSTVTFAFFRNENSFGS